MKLHLHNPYIYQLFLLDVYYLITVAVSLTYLDFDPNIIEGQEYTFTCQTTDGNPGSVIKWQINGNSVDDDLVDQDNSTDPSTQISHLTLTAEQEMETLQCIAHQVSNKPPVNGQVKILNVLCMLI